MLFLALCLSYGRIACNDCRLSVSNPSGFALFVTKCALMLWTSHYSYFVRDNSMVRKLEPATSHSDECDPDDIYLIFFFVCPVTVVGQSNESATWHSHARRIVCVDTSPRAMDWPVRRPPPRAAGTRSIAYPTMLSLPSWGCRCRLWHFYYYWVAKRTR